MDTVSSVDEQTLMPAIPLLATWLDPTAEGVESFRSRGDSKNLHAVAYGTFSTAGAIRVQAHVSTDVLVCDGSTPFGSSWNGPDVIQKLPMSISASVGTSALVVAEAQQKLRSGCC